MNLGARLLKAMTLKGIKQEELAERVNCTQGSITKLVNNKSKKSKFLLAIARELNCDPNWLETGKGKPPNSLQDKIPFITWDQMDELCRGKEFTLDKNVSFLDYQCAESEQLYALKNNREHFFPLPFNGVIHFNPSDILILKLSNDSPKIGEYWITYSDKLKKSFFLQLAGNDLKKYFLHTNALDEESYRFDLNMKSCAIVICRITIL